MNAGSAGADAAARRLADLASAAAGATDEAAVRAAARRVPPPRGVGEATWRAAVDGVVRGNLARVRAEAEATRDRAARRDRLDALERAQEAERARVAHVLTEEVGQTLTALVLEGGGDAVAPGRVRALAAHARAEVRRVASALRGSVLDDLGVAAALRTTAREASLRYGLPVVVTATLPRLPRRHERLLDLAGREALANVVRHADADCASVVATAGPDRVDLVVEDDGVGFDAGGVPPAGGGGLGDLRARVEGVGGRLRIESQPGRGAAVYVRLPRATH